MLDSSALALFMRSLAVASVFAQKRLASKDLHYYCAYVSPDVGIRLQLTLYFQETS